jgi:hypothetical protein
LLFYAKHVVVFRNFVPGGGIYGAMNLAVMTSYPLPPEALDTLITSGKISPIMKTDILKFVKKLQAEDSSLARMVPVPPKTGIPVLDACRKSTQGVNFNCTWAANLMNVYRTDSLVVLRYYPKAYWQSVAGNVMRYFLPDTEGWPMDGRTDVEDLRILSRPLAAYNLLTTGLWPPALNLPWLSYLALPGLLGFALSRAIHGILDVLKGRRRLQDDPATITLVFMVCNIIFLTVAVVLLSEADQNRYRSELSPYFAVILGGLLTTALKRISR